MESRGSKKQRLLWASTSTKNPEYKDTIYVDKLIGPETVNTMPLSTLNATMDHAEVRPTLEEGIDEARKHFEELREAGVYYDDVVELLETGGGVTKALPLLGNSAFFAANADVLWYDGATPALARLAEMWDEDKMDALLLLQRTVTAHGYEGQGDYFLDPLGHARRRRECPPRFLLSRMRPDENAAPT